MACGRHTQALPDVDTPQNGAANGPVEDPELVEWEQAKRVEGLLFPQSDFFTREIQSSHRRGTSPRSKSVEAPGDGLFPSA
jgi:hypothetical protein